MFLECGGPAPLCYLALSSNNVRRNKAVPGHGIPKYMGTAPKIILRSALGAVTGALSGAALLAVPTYFSTKTGFLGPESAWWPLAAIVGGFWGAIAGAVIGFLVAMFEMKKFNGAIVGSAVGASIVVIVLLLGMDPFADSDIFINVLGSVPIGSVIGIIISATNRPPNVVVIDETPLTNAR